MTTRTTKLAPNFTFGELVRTNHRRFLDDNFEQAKDFLEPLSEVAATLQHVRDHYGKAVIVHSGFRCVALNKAIGGSRYSQHRKGEAADFHVRGEDLTEVWTWIWKLSGIPFGQLILEGVQAGQPTWIHLSLGAPWRRRDRCGQVLTWDAANGYHRVD